MMYSGNEKEALCRVAKILYDQGHREALRLLMMSDADYKPESYELDSEGFDTVQPAVFTLYAPEEFMESYRRGSDEYKQIAGAFATIHPEECYVWVVLGEPSQGVRWQDIFARRHPEALAST